MAIVSIEENIIVGKWLPKIGGYSWTLTSRLGDMLSKSQKVFGDRDKTFTILGIEFIEDHPKIWYIGDKQIIIQLSTNCICDEMQAIYQLAHESIHCLGPVIGGVANRLEEGLATYFAKDYMENLFPGSDWNSCGQNYNEAKDEVEKLLKFDADIIKKVRLIKPHLTTIIRDDILQQNCSIPTDLIDKLLLKF